jgi:predicted nucleic acid-binding protein
MKVLLGTNVILDVLLQREPHYRESAEVWAAIEEGRVEGFTSAHAFTTIHYIARKAATAQQATETVKLILEVLEVAGVSGDVVHRAIELDWPDFEDAVTASAALESGCDLIVTRDTAGFSRSPIKALTPRAALALFKRGTPGRKRR